MEASFLGSGRLALFKLALLASAFLHAGCTSDSPDVPRVGALVRVIGFKGTVDGTFQKPRVVAAAPDGDVYAIDMTGRIQCFGPDGEFRKAWRTPAIERGKPVGAAFSPEGHLIVADTHYQRLLVYSTGGSLLAWTAGGLKEAQGSDSGIGGRFGHEPGAFVYPTGIAFGPDGTWFVSEYGGNDRIQVFPAYRETPIRQFGAFGTGPGEFQRLSAVAFGPVTGRLYAVDTGGHRIHLFAPDGTRKDTWGRLGDGPGELRYPYGIATDKDERVYISEFGNHRIQVFDQDGRSLGVFGGPGTEDGQFDTPRGIALARDGTLWVADGENHRLQVIRFPWTP